MTPVSQPLDLARFLRQQAAGIRHEGLGQLGQQPQVQGDEQCGINPDLPTASSARHQPGYGEECQQVASQQTGTPRPVSRARSISKPRTSNAPK